jgi:hypothetical protein
MAMLVLFEAMIAKYREARALAHEVLPLRCEARILLQEMFAPGLQARDFIQAMLAHC